MEEKQQLAVLIERLENLISQNTEAHCAITLRLDKVNGTVGSLKTWRAYITGALALMSAILVPAAILIFSKFLDNKF